MTNLKKTDGIRGVYSYHIDDVKKCCDGKSDVCKSALFTENRSKQEGLSFFVLL